MGEVYRPTGLSSDALATHGRLGLEVAAKGDLLWRRKHVGTVEENGRFLAALEEIVGR